MALKGYIRQAGIAAAAAASFGMLMTAAGVAAPIAAAEESESDAATWTMPDTEGSLLKNAVAATYEAAGTEDIEVEFDVSGINQVVYNYTNWRVCGQSPSADEDVEVTGEPATVEFEVARPGGCE